MKNILSILVLLLCMGLVACNEEYDPDTAESYYTPAPGRRVASVKTTFGEIGGEVSHEHSFTYDAQGRIKSVSSTLLIYQPWIDNSDGFGDTVYYRCNIVSNANYFYRGEELEVAYTVSTDYPENPKLNRLSSGSRYGVFDSKGVLARFAQTSFEYSATRLMQAYTDGEMCYDIARDGDGNVTGYKKYNVYTDEVFENIAGCYHYHSLKNRSNFDFSAYFGYWGVEQFVAQTYRAPYQLAAFGMLGSTSQYLPCGIIEKDADGKDRYICGEWELDSSDYPVSYVDAEGRRTVVTYCE